jgi:hypothetical protein
VPSEPPPLATAKVTLTPETGFPCESVTRTLGGVATTLPTVALWLLPALIAMVFAAPAVPVAVKVRGEPVSPALVAVKVFVPAVVPKVQAGDVAIPEALVVTVAGVPSEPPPLATAKVTLTPETGFPCESVTRTLGFVDTAVPTVALWLLPALIVTVLAAPADISMPVLADEVKPSPAKVSVYVDPLAPVKVKPENVATPEEKVPDVPPAEIAPPLPEAIVALAVPEFNDVSTFPAASSTLTTGC